MTEDERFRQWQTWFETIYDDLQAVLARRYIFRQVQDIIETNPRIQKPSLFFSWMSSVHAISSVIAVRRQVDQEEKAISLVKLLSDIRRHAQVLSRERYVALYGDDHLKEVGHREFDSLVGVAARHIDLRTVQDDLTNLRDATKHLERFATLRVAHFDPSPPERIPSHGELEDVLDLMEKLLRKYQLLLFAWDREIVPMIPYDWKAIFREAWIPQPADSTEHPG